MIDKSITTIDNWYKYNFISKRAGYSAAYYAYQT